MDGKSIYLLLFQDDEQWRVNKIQINVDQVQVVTNCAAVSSFNFTALPNNGQSKLS